MDNSEQIFAFVSEINKTVHRFRREFELTTAAAIGGLEMVKLALFADEMQQGEDDGEDELD